MHTEDAAPSRHPRDRLRRAAEEPLRPDSLVGSFFHSRHLRDDGESVRQGAVVAEVAPGVYLVELFGWIAGESIDQELIRLEDMTDWRFYDSADWMNQAYHASPRALRAREESERAHAERAKRRREEREGSS